MNFRDNPIYPLIEALGRSLRLFMSTTTKLLFYIASKEAIRQKKIKAHEGGVKSAILAIFQYCQTNMNLTLELLTQA